MEGEDELAQWGREGSVRVAGPCGVSTAVEEHGRCPVGFQWSWNKGQAAGTGTSRKGTGRGRLILLQHDPDLVSPYGAGTQ